MTPPHERLELPKTAMRLQITHAMPSLGKQIPHLLDKIALVIRDVAFEFVTRAKDNLGRR